MDVLNDILDSLNESIIIIDPFGQIVFYNKEALHIQKSISAKPVQIGDQIPDVLSQEHKKGIIEILKAVRIHKKSLVAYAECNMLNGGKIFLELKFVPVLDKTCRVKFINIIIQDITTRKVLEKRAQAAAEDIKSLIEHAHALILSVDSRGYIVECNSLFAEITGFNKHEIYCQKASEILVKHGQVYLVDQLMQGVLKNRPVTNFQLPIQTRSGRELIWMLSATPRTNTHREVIGATWIGQDITELTGYRTAFRHAATTCIQGFNRKSEVRRKILQRARNQSVGSGLVRITCDFFQKIFLHERWAVKNTPITQNLPPSKAV